MLSSGDNNKVTPIPIQLPILMLCKGWYSSHLTEECVHIIDIVNTPILSLNYIFKANILMTCDNIFCSFISKVNILIVYIVYYMTVVRCQV